MEKWWIITAIIGVLVLGVLGGVDPEIPSSLKNDEPHPLEAVFEP